MIGVNQVTNRRISLSIDMMLYALSLFYFFCLVFAFKCVGCSICYSHEELLLKHMKYCVKKPVNISVSSNGEETTLGGLVGSNGNSSSKKRESHPCHVCGRMFTCASNLEIHLRVHSGDKPHCCEVCGKRFRRQGHLRREGGV